MTHSCYGRSIQDTTGQLTHTRRSDGPPESGALQKVTRDKIRHYRSPIPTKNKGVKFQKKEKPHQWVENGGGRTMFF